MGRDDEVCVCVNTSSHVDIKHGENGSDTDNYFFK